MDESTGPFRFYREQA